MLVPDLLGLEFLGIFLLVDLLEDVLEAAVVFLENGVLGAHVKRETLHESHFETSVSEASDRVVSVVLSHGDTAAVEVVDLDGLGLSAVPGGVDQLELAGVGDHAITGLVLVTEGVTADNDGLGPARHKTRDLRDEDGFTEDGTAAGGVSFESRRVLQTTYRMFLIVPLGESHTARLVEAPTIH